MNSLSIWECSRKYQIPVQKILYLKNYILLFSEKGNYLLKIKDSPKKELFQYLESISYPYYLPLVNDYNDSYELYPYYEDKTFDKNIKAKEIVYALSVLHLSSSFYEEVNEDDFKKMYEEISSKIDYLMKYYFDLQDYIEQFSFPRMDYYYLINHISDFYRILRISFQKLDSWYQKKTSKVRKSYIIQNVCLSNFRLGDVSYFLDYKDCIQDILVYDFVSFYKHEVLNLDMDSFFHYYQSKISFTPSELDLFYCLICIPEKIEFSKNIYNNTIEIRRSVDYIEKTLQFVSEKNKENQETNKEKFKEEN